MAGGLNGHFYVAPNGNDADTGAIDQPFATINRARLAVRALIAGGHSTDVWVYLRDGIYPIEAPIAFDPEDSAPANSVIHFSAFPGERPVISGGRFITDWTDHADGTWTTTVPGVQSGEWTFRELFVNGMRRQRSRHPNTGFLTVAGPDPAVGPATRYSFSFATGDLPAGANLAGAELNMLHEWTTSRVKIAQANHTSNVLTTAEPIGATGLIESVFQTGDHPRYAVENHIALLDAPGEWHLDPATGLLTYRPMPGEFAETAEVVAPIATELLVVRGDFNLETPVRNIRFIDLSFEHCAWALPSGGYSTYQSGYYEWRDTSTPYDLPAAVKFEMAENCQLIQARVAHCGGWGVILGAMCRDCSLVGSIVTDIAGNGVLVGEDRYRRVDGDFWINTRPDQVAIGNQITSNLIQDCGVELQDCAGVWVGLTEASQIQNNLIRRMPHISLSTGGLWNDDPSPARQISIVNNRIQGAVQLLSDGAAIYSVGLQPNSVIRDNLISDIPPHPGLSRNIGIFLDEGSTGFQVLGNGLYNIASSPFKFHRAGVNKLIANTMRLSASDVQPYFYVSMDPANIIRIGNVVIDPEDPPAGCAYPVCGTASTAGLLPAYQPSIYADRDNDGIPDIDDACVNRAPGDLNGDGVVNGLDIEPMICVLSGQTNSSDAYCAADTDGDGIAALADVETLIGRLLGQ